jgi:hypothetical protein
LSRPTRTWCASCSRSRSRDRRRLGRDRRRRPRVGPPLQDRRPLDGRRVNPKGACIGRWAQRVRRRDERAERREDRHHRLVGGSGHVRRQRPARRRRWFRSPCSTPRCRTARVVVPDFQLSLADRQGRPERARLAARLTGGASTSAATPTRARRPARPSRSRSD